MGIIKIEKVQREGARLVIMLCGVSGCGKTKTALELAYGMVGGDGNKIGFLDTENRRGKLYADDYKSPYLYGELKPPFSPDRYIKSIEEFCEAKVEVLIIDSGSHEFEGIGGIQDIADANKGMWNKAKAEHKRFMSTLLNSPMHIILCLRAREKAKPEVQVIENKKKTVYIDLGLQPITEKNVVFEATASLMLHDQGTRHDPLKIPSALQKILGRGTGYIGQEEGKAIRAWVDGAKQLDPEVERHRGMLQMAAEQGMVALVAAWGKVPKEVKSVIGPKGCPDELKASAKAFDDAAAEAKLAETAGNSGNDAAAIDSLNKAVQQGAGNENVPAPDPADDEMFG